MITREGIIVRSIKFQENSKIIYVITDTGLTSLLVRNANSPKSHNFCYSQELTKIGYDFSSSRGKGFDTLTVGKIIDNYSNIRNDYNKLTNALIIIELAYQMNEHIEDYNMFYNFLVQILDKLNNSDYPKYFSIIFRLKILYLLGVGPSFSSCVICGSKNNLNGFVFESGGFKCNDCITEADRVLDSEMIGVLKIMYLLKLENVNDELLRKLPDKINDIDKFLNDYYTRYLSFDSKVQRVINKLDKGIK